MSERYDIKLVVDASPDSNFDHWEIYRAPELPIIGAAAGGAGVGTITIEGRFASWYDVGDELEISGSTWNNGTYTVASVSETTGDTVITMVEAVPSSVADGYLQQVQLSQLAISTKSTSAIDKELPAGYYYYVIYAVDKDERYSDPSNIIIRTAPENTVAPATPTGLTVQRSSDLLTMELFWNANTESDLKGYVIYRSFDGATYDLIAVVSSNYYKDNKIPKQQNTDFNTTPCIYAVSAINKSLTEGFSAGPTTVLEVPILTGLRVIVDYLSLSVYWDYNLPEDGLTSYKIYYREVGVVPWTYAGEVDHPQTSFKIVGPLTKDKTYEVGIVVVPYTGGTGYVQPLPAPVTIPDYETDVTPPNSPEFLEANLDPEEDRIFMSWRRKVIDDDFLHYGVYWAKRMDIIHVGVKRDITYVNQVMKTFRIAGEHASLMSSGDAIIITGSNAGTYTIDAVWNGTGETNIAVDQAIPSPTVDGDINFALDKGFTVDGDQSEFFTAGESLFVTGSTGNDGTYTVNSVIAGNTPITTSIMTIQLLPSLVGDGQLFQFILDGITTQNNWTFRNFKNYFAGEDSPPLRPFMLQVKAVDRSGNVSVLDATAYLYLFWNSLDLEGPNWMDFIRSIPTSYFASHVLASPDPTTFRAQFIAQWNDISRAAAHFRRYVIFETLDLLPAGDPITHLVAPDFDLNDDANIRGFSNDNTYYIYSDQSLRGFSTTDSERVILAAGQTPDYFEVLGDQRGHFLVGSTVRAYGTPFGNDGDYVVSSISMSAGNTRVFTSGLAIASASGGGRLYDINLDGMKWLTVLAEDWFGDRYGKLVAPQPYLGVR